MFIRTSSKLFPSLEHFISSSTTRLREFTQGSVKPISNALAKELSNQCNESSASIKKVQF